METRLRYSPTDCFVTFAFPRNPPHEAALGSIGEACHEHRRALMRDLWLGLTDLYNLFHRPDLTPDVVEAERGDRATVGGPEGFARILRLRELHRELDQAVLTAYGWNATSDFGPPLALGHDFHSVEYLPENDRTRFTIHPDARREVLARLLKLNHQRAAEAEAAPTTTISPTAVAAAKTAKQAKAAEAQERRHSKGINFKRGAIASYAIERLASRPEFGRTQLEKVLYLAQHEVEINLEMEFRREAAGPFDEEIHKLESLAARNQWFTNVRPTGGGAVRYFPGPKIADRCGAAVAYLGESKPRFDAILDQIEKMNTEQAEVWTTVHAAWNDLILSNSSVSDGLIIEEVYAWHPAKAKFTRDRILACINWMRQQGFVPRGIRFETRKPAHSPPDTHPDLFDLLGG